MIDSLSSSREPADRASPDDDLGQAAIPGLRYRRDYLSARQAIVITERVEAQPWLSDLKRRVQHYGWRYDYQRRVVTQDLYLGPLPEWGQELAQRLHHDGLMPLVADQLIVNEYLPGQGISPHIDCQSCFADTIASISLGSGCVMEFTQPNTPEPNSNQQKASGKVELYLHAGSVLVFSGEARYQWRHGIPARKSDPRPSEIIAPSGKQPAREQPAREQPAREQPASEQRDREQPGVGQHNQAASASRVARSRRISLTFRTVRLNSP